MHVISNCRGIPDELLATMSEDFYAFSAGWIARLFSLARSSGVGIFSFKFGECFMTKTLRHNAKFLSLSLIGACALAGALSSAADAKSKCSKGTDVVFIEDTGLTNGSVWVCTAFEGGHGTAIRLGAHKKSCLVEYWGKCKGSSDTGWARLETFRAFHRRR